MHAVLCKGRWFLLIGLAVSVSVMVDARGTDLSQTDNDNEQPGLDAPVSRGSGSSRTNSAGQSARRKRAEPRAPRNDTGKAPDRASARAHTEPEKPGPFEQQLRDFGDTCLRCFECCMICLRLKRSSWPPS